MRELRRVVIKEELVELTGDFKKAVILNQFIYWSNRIRDVDKYIKEEKERANEDGIKLNVEESKGWIYKKADELSLETMLGLSASNISGHIKWLVENEWLHKRRNPKRAWDKTLQYRVNLVKIMKDLKVLGFSLEGYPILIKSDENKINIENEELNNYDLEPEIDNRTSETELGTFETQLEIIQNRNEFNEIKENSEERNIIDPIYGKVISETEVRTSKTETRSSETENRTSKTKEQYQRLHTEITNKDYIHTTSSSEEDRNIKIHNNKNYEEESERDKKEVNSNYIEGIIGIKFNEFQKRLINTWDLDKLKCAIGHLSVYENKSNNELYKLLVVIYNNPNNHKVKNKDDNNNGKNLKSQKTSGFNNFEPGDYDYDEIEKKLLGWDSD